MVADLQFGMTLRFEPSLLPKRTATNLVPPLDSANRGTSLKLVKNIGLMTCFIVILKSGFGCCYRRRTAGGVAFSVGEQLAD